jgi:AcrR family transcriptional regulator
MPRQPEQTREKLIGATIAIAQLGDIGALTLDQVAKEAGVSKGGLLHHFPSKEALMEAAVRQLFEQFNALAQTHYQTDATEPGRWLRAYIRATYDSALQTLELSIKMLLTYAENEGVVKVLREDYELWSGRLHNDGISKARATILRQAADAFWLEILLGEKPYSPQEKATILEELLAMVTEAVGK